MSDNKRWTARCVREGKWWTVNVDGARAFTQAARLDQVPQRVTEALYLLDGVEAAPEDIDIEAHLPGEDSLVEDARSKRQEAHHAQAVAEEITAAVVRRLHKAGLPYRDIGVMLDMSHQRAQQIAARDLVDS